jgi:hypothetical protein
LICTSGKIEEIHESMKEFCQSSTRLQSCKGLSTYSANSPPPTFQSTVSSRKTTPLHFFLHFLPRISHKNPLKIEGDKQKRQFLTLKTLQKTKALKE